MQYTQGTLHDHLALVARMGYISGLHGTEIETVLACYHPQDTAQTE